MRQVGPFEQQCLRHVRHLGLRLLQRVPFGIQALAQFCKLRRPRRQLRSLPLERLRLLGEFAGAVFELGLLTSESRLPRNQLGACFTNLFRLAGQPLLKFR